jgi:hypothetical protein
MPSAFSWPALLPSALPATAPVNLGDRPLQKHSLETFFSNEQISGRFKHRKAKKMTTLCFASNHAHWRTRSLWKW